MIISNKLSLYKFFKKLNFDLYLTEPQLGHLENILNDMISKSFNSIYWHHFNIGYKVAKKDLEKSKVIYIYQATTSCTPIEEFFE